MTSSVLPLLLDAAGAAEGTSPPIAVQVNGGSANAQFNSSADGAQTSNYNPIFSTGSGSITANPSDTATQSPSAAVSGLLSPYAPAAAAQASPLSGSTLLLLIGAIALVLILPEGRR